jgi:hypothetical protein
MAGMEQLRKTVQDKNRHHRYGDLWQCGNSFLEQPHQSFFLFFMAF